MLHHIAGALEPTRRPPKTALRGLEHGLPLLLVLLTITACSLTIWLSAISLSLQGKIALNVLLLAVVGWSVVRISDAIIGLAAASTLVLTGVIEQQALIGSLGHELIWLLIAAFIIAAVLRESGAIGGMIDTVIRRASTVRSLFWLLTLAISATAFVIPSTSARAALLVPVYLGIADRIEDQSVRRALALLFPSVVLLSAAGSLFGAGAHLIAVDYLQRTTSVPLSAAKWAMTALPFALGTSAIATWCILTLFVERDAQLKGVALVRSQASHHVPPSLVLMAIVATTVVLWMTTAWHGLSMAMVGIVGVCLVLLPGISKLTAKDAFKSIEIELIVLLATTLVIVDAVSRSGVDAWLARSLLLILPGTIAASTWAVVTLMAVVSLTSHLIIPSRTARASVLIPGLAMPLSALGHDPQLLVMVTILGTGFCQTLPASAKPVMIFANLPQPTFATGDLIRLSAHLFPALLVVLIVYALLMWGR